MGFNGVVHLQKQLPGWLEKHNNTKLGRSACEMDNIKKNNKEQPG
jgi:hypothetical protein